MSSTVKNAGQDAEELPNRRRAGRPPKPDALSAAERAKRYRDKLRAKNLQKNTQNSVELSREVARLTETLVQLQMRYDLEHLKLVQLETELASLRGIQERPTVNPLAAKVAELKRTIAAQDADQRKLIDEFNKRDSVKLRK
jgi:hypothetical protein